MQNLRAFWHTKEGMTKDESGRVLARAHEEFAEFFALAEEGDATLLEQLVLFAADPLFRASLHRENRLHVSGRELAEQSATNEGILVELQNGLRTCATFAKVSCAMQAKLLEIGAPPRVTIS
jgi:hypothetical protein